MLFVSGDVLAQKLSFQVGDAPVFIDENGDTLKYATAGGVNAPQMHPMDVDNDGKLDLLLFDRSDNRIMVMIQNDNGSYTLEPDYSGLFPNIEDWLITNDFNGDGKMDLWFRNGLNQSIALYKNITQSWDKHLQLEVVTEKLTAYNFNTDTFFWEDTFYTNDYVDMYCNRPNIPAVQDIDGDGDMDFLTLQASGTGVTLFLNVSKETGKSLEEPVFEEADFCWGDFKESVDTVNSIDLERYQFCYRKIYRYLKKHSGGSTMLLFDNDDDGDMDLLLGNAGFDNLIFLENGKKDLNKQIDTIIAWTKDFPSAAHPGKIPMFPGAFYMDVDGDNVKDLLVAPNTVDKSSYQRIDEFDNVLFWKNNGADNKPNFSYQQNDFLVGDMVDNGSRGASTLFDYDGDGDMDIVVAVTGGYHLTQDSADRLYLYENVGTSSASSFKLIDKDFLGLSSAGIKWMVPQIVDINQGGNPELILGTSTGELRTYLLDNTGGNWSASLLSDKAFGITVSSASAPFITDVNKDGKVDLLLGSYDGNTRYYKNVSSTNVPSFQLEEDTFGGVLSNGYAWQSVYIPSKDIFVDSFAQLNYGISYPILQDLDGDGNREFIVGGAHGNVYIYTDVENNYNGKFTKSEIGFFNNVTLSYDTLPDFGSVARPVFGDFNGDTITDMLVWINRGGVQFRKGSTTLSARGFNKVIGETDLTIAPNPTTGIVKVLSDRPINEIRVLDLNGKLLSGSNTRSIDLSTFSPGVYILHIRSGDNWSAARVIKK